MIPTFEVDFTSTRSDVMVSEAESVSPCGNWCVFVGQMILVSQDTPFKTNLVVQVRVCIFSQP